MALLVASPLLVLAWAALALRLGLAAVCLVRGVLRLRGASWREWLGALGGSCLLLGLATRLAALALGTAALVELALALRQRSPEWERACLVAAAAAALLILGGGAFSLDGGY